MALLTVARLLKFLQTAHVSSFTMFLDEISNGKRHIGNFPITDFEAVPSTCSFSGKFLEPRLPEILAMSKFLIEKMGIDIKVEVKKYDFKGGSSFDGKLTVNANSVNNKNYAHNEIEDLFAKLTVYLRDIEVGKYEKQHGLLAKLLQNRIPQTGVVSTSKDVHIIFPKESIKLQDYSVIFSNAGLSAQVILNELHVMIKPEGFDPEVLVDSIERNAPLEDRISLFSTFMGKIFSCRTSISHTQSVVFEFNHSHDVEVAKRIFQELNCKLSSTYIYRDGFVVNSLGDFTRSLFAEKLVEYNLEQNNLNRLNNIREYYPELFVRTLISLLPKHPNFAKFILQNFNNLYRFSNDNSESFIKLAGLCFDSIIKQGATTTELLFSIRQLPSELFSRVDNSVPSSQPSGLQKFLATIPEVGPILAEMISNLGDLEEVNIHRAIQHYVRYLVPLNQDDMNFNPLKFATVNLPLDVKYKMLCTLARLLAEVEDPTHAFIFKAKNDGFRQTLKTLRLAGFHLVNAKLKVNSDDFMKNEVLDLEDTREFLESAILEPLFAMHSSSSSNSFFYKLANKETDAVIKLREYIEQAYKKSGQWAVWLRKQTLKSKSSSTAGNREISHAGNPAEQISPLSESSTSLSTSSTAVSELTTNTSLYSGSNDIRFSIFEDYDSSIRAKFEDPDQIIRDNKIALTAEMDFLANIATLVRTESLSYSNDTGMTLKALLVSYLSTLDSSPSNLSSHKGFIKRFEIANVEGNDSSPIEINEIQIVNLFLNLIFSNKSEDFSFHYLLYNSNKKSLLEIIPLVIVNASKSKSPLLDEIKQLDPELTETLAGLMTAMNGLCEILSIDNTKRLAR